MVDNTFSPMLYDVMCELATQLQGRYVEWMDEAASVIDEEHWRAEHALVMRELREIDPDSQADIEAHTVKLRRVLAAMPRHAPVLA